ncbi:histone deacetylase [Streptomyces sp. NPDC052069]|uniref:histone deacetylase n=1 Tax=Streptomyces sp. NPDC052069 TaxID=3154650 RepID=UPI00342CA88E
MNVNPRVIDTAGAAGPVRRVWYTAYGSNTHRDRLARYLAGGRLPGTDLTYPGCRDPRPPAASAPVELVGQVYFATESPVWTGGRAFYDPRTEGRALARAHLVTVGQFSDIVAQEMNREPGADLDLSEVMEHGRAVLGPGRYETLVCPGTLDGCPVLTFTAPWGVRGIAWNKPSAPYVRVLASGLLDAGAWDVRTIAEYVVSCPGAAGAWKTGEVAELIREQGDMGLPAPPDSGPR